MEMNHLHHFKDYDRFLVGFDGLFDRMTKLRDGMKELQSNYPPYNIRKVEDNKYVIELAVAGFGQNEIEIEFQDGKLVISAKAQTAQPDWGWVYKGISDRGFQRQFHLADNVEIRGADYFNGLLKIWLEQIIPESKKPRKIQINEKSEDSGESEGGHSRFSQQALRSKKN